jgi:hypothetical protein
MSAAAGLGPGHPASWRRLSASARRHDDAVGLGPSSWRRCRPRPGVMATLSASAPGRRHGDTVCLRLENGDAVNLGPASWRNNGDAVNLGPASWRRCLPRTGHGDAVGPDPASWRRCGPTSWQWSLCHSDTVGLRPASWQRCRPRPSVMAVLLRP